MQSKTSVPRAHGKMAIVRIRQSVAWAICDVIVDFVDVCGIKSPDDCCALRFLSTHTIFHDLMACSLESRPKW